MWHRELFKLACASFLSRIITRTHTHTQYTLMQSITRQLAFDARTISLRRSAQKKRTETKNWRANLHDPISGTNEWTADELKSNAVPVMIPGNAPDYLHGMLSYNRVYPPKLSGLSDQFDRHLIVAVVSFFFLDT